MQKVRLVRLSALRSGMYWMSHAYPYPKKPLKKIADLVKQLLTLDPDRRISVSAMLEHPWLREQGVAPGMFECSTKVRCVGNVQFHNFQGD